jgi:hypothetical protein
MMSRPAHSRHWKRGKNPAGTRSWSIDVPPGVGGYFEIEADHPCVGDKLTMHVKANGHAVDDQSEKLEQALQPGTALFLQDHYSRLFERERRIR